MVYKKLLKHAKLKMSLRLSILNTIKSSLDFFCSKPDKKIPEIKFDTIAASCKQATNLGDFAQQPADHFFIGLATLHKCGSKFKICTLTIQVRFASFFFDGFITAIVVNTPERRLAKCTSVQYDFSC